ncbi:MAG: hypothetical protein JW811_03870 [Clostridiales bacterium]|nr:hypothetical protein [Clostridiales bacterium]
MSKIIEMLIELNNQGYSREELKESVISVLTPYFDHPEVLDDYWTSCDILSVFEYFIRYGYNEDFLNGLRNVLEIFKEGRIKNTDALFSILTYNEAQKNYLQQENKMWTVRQYDYELDNGNDLYKTVMDLFQHIKKAIEIGAKPYIFELLATIKLTTTSKCDYSRVLKMKLGVAVMSIIDQNKLLTELMIPPLKIKLSDWRNIAAHESYCIANNNQIVCTNKDDSDVFILSLDDLIDYTHKIIRTINIFSIGRCIFTYDNISELAAYQQKDEKQQGQLIRNEILEHRLRASFLSQSFFLDTLEISENTATAHLVDLLNNGTLVGEKIRDRYIHSSQFLFPLWQNYRKRLLQVFYYNSKKTVCFKTSVIGDVCSKYNSGEENLDYFAKNVIFEHTQADQS